MDLRELIILVLGLTIVGVVVRGLLVALKARKSQLRLAIDKNIPKDIDLEAIELAELPSGGARVVRRSPDELHASNIENEGDALPNIPALKPSPSSPEVLPLVFEESIVSVESEGTEETGVTDEPPAVLAEELYEKLTEKPLEERPQELLEESSEEFPEEIAVDSASTHTISLGDGIDDDDDEFSSISLSAGDRIGGIKESPKTPSKKDSRGSSIPAAESTNDHSALFENYEQDQSAEASPSEVSGIVSENDSPAVTDLFPETFAQEEPKPEVQESADASPGPLSPGVNDAKEQVAPAIEEKPKGAAASEVSEVLVLNVTAKKGRLIMGERLLSLMQGLDLEYGERKIFSKRTNGTDRGSTLFNVANMLQPGTFDLNNMENFATVGVTLFLALPSPISNFEAFEEMLQIAQDIVRSIDGELRDDQRNMMTGQTIEHYRQRVRDFELRRLRSRAAAG